MPDMERPMNDHEIAKGLGALLATRFADQPREGEEPNAAQVVPDDEPDTEASLADQGEEDVEGDEGEPDEADANAAAIEFSLPIKYKGEERVIADQAEATRLAQLGMHFEERQHEIVTREKAVDSASTEADQLRSRYAASLSEVAQFFEQVTGAPPKETDYPSREQYLEAVNQHLQAQTAVKTYRDEIQRVQDEQIKAEQAKLERWAKAQEDETLAAVPEWHDPAVRQADVKEMTEYAEKLGMPQVGPMFVNAKWFRVMLRDAARYAKAKDTGSAEVKRVKTKEAAPGSGPNTRQDGTARRRKELFERGKSGKVDDLAPIATQLLQRNAQLNRTAKR